MTLTASSLVSFTSDGPDLVVQDEQEGRALTLTAGADISPQPAIADLLPAPTDAAVSFSAEELTVGTHASVFLRDAEGDIVAEPEEEPETFPRGTYYLDVSGAVKTYVRIPDAVPTIVYTGEKYESPARLSLDAPATLTVGARSLHSRPEATITVPDDPEAMMEAVSYLGSSIKEFSPERSWPNLRGHPPAIERGEALRIPDRLSQPETGFTVTVPPTYADVYRVAPLAFYFGATVEPGEPALRLPNGYVEQLGTRGESLEESVSRLVSTCLFLDALARQGGYNPIPLYEYDLVAPHLPFYPENLATEPFVDQIMEYLEAPTGPVVEAFPLWSATAVLRPAPEDVTLLPSLLDAMAHVSVAESPPSPRLVRDSSPSPPVSVGYTHAAVPSGGARLQPAAFDRQLSRDVPSVHDVQIAVVTDDQTRANRLREGVTDTARRPSSEQIGFHTAPTRAELRDLLASNADLVICDLPTTGAGVECADGTLDPNALDVVDAAAVVLDAGGEDDDKLARQTATGPEATSIEAASTLVDQGAVVGMTARTVTAPEQCFGLLTCLLAGHDLATTARLVYGDEGYRLAGNPIATLATLDGSVNAGCFRVDAVAPDEHEVVLETYPTRSYGLGSVIRAEEEFSHGEYQLVGSRTPMPTTIATERVVALLEDDDHVVVLDGELYSGVEPATPALVERSACHALADCGEGIRTDDDRATD